MEFESDEQILMKIRKHWLIIFGRVLMLVVLMFLPYLAWGVASRFGIIQIQGNTTALGAALSGMWFLLLWMAFFNFWTTGYYLDLWIVTNKRIIDIQQKRFFSREIGSLRLDRAQDVEVEVDGFLESVFGVGHIRVQSAGEIQEFTMDGIARPYQVKDELSKLINQAVEAQRRVIVDQP